MSVQTIEMSNSVVDIKEMEIIENSKLPWSKYLANTFKVVEIYVLLVYFGTYNVISTLNCYNKIFMVV